MALDGDVSSVSRPGLYTTGRRAPVIHCVGGWVGPRADLDAVAKRKISCLLREFNPSLPACSLATILSYLGSPGYKD
jgi:hypothetical protein